MTLSKKYRAFVDEYLMCFNATEAYMRVYNPKKRTTAGANGHELLKNTEISDEIEKRLQEKHMSADEALKRMADIARGDLGEFVNDFGMIDISGMRKAGKTHLIKRLKTKTVIVNGKEDDTETHIQDVELYPADAAIRDVLKVAGRFSERIEINGKQEIIIKYESNNNNTPDPA